nr:hypothetical protein BaRGS_034043 [Batillaria attramentaria]
MNSTASDLIDVNVTDGNNDTLDHYRNYAGDYDYSDRLAFWTDKMYTLWKVSSPIILTLGTFGNVMIILVLRKMLSEASAFPLLFMALAITDLLQLYVGLLPTWISYQFHYSILDESEVSCRLFLWLEHSLKVLSAWLLTAMTVQRAMSTTWPLKMRTVRPRRQAVLTIGVLVVASIAVISPVLYAVSTNALIEGGRCWWTKDFQTYVRIMFWIMMFLLSFLPSVIMIICNCLMIRAMRRSSKKANTRSKSRSANPGSGALPRVTVTLIVVSIAFLLLTLPYYVNQILLMETVFLKENPSWKHTLPVRFWYRVTTMMFFLNSAINFFLYILPGSTFREEVKKMFCKAERSNPNQLPA